MCLCSELFFWIFCQGPVLQQKNHVIRMPVVFIAKKLPCHQVGFTHAQNLVALTGSLFFILSLGIGAWAKLVSDKIVDALFLPKWVFFVSMLKLCAATAIFSILSAYCIPSRHINFVQLHKLFLMKILSYFFKQDRRHPKFLNTYCIFWIDRSSNQVSRRSIRK